MLHLSGSGLGVSGAVLAEIAPVLLLAPIAGPLVDRLPRVTVMVTADLVRVVLAAVLVLWHNDITIVYPVAFGLSAGSVFFNPAAGSLLPTLVAEEELVAANSGIFSAAVLTQILLAPRRWARHHRRILLGVRRQRRQLRHQRRPAARFGADRAAPARDHYHDVDAEPGGSHAAGSRPVAAGPRSRPILRRALGRGDERPARCPGRPAPAHTTGIGYGLLLSAIGVGAFTGPLLLTRPSARVRSPRVVFGAFGLRGLVDLVLATVTALPAAVAASAFYGLGTSTGNVTFATLIQTHVPPELRGRVFSAFDLIWQSMRLVSLLLGGYLADTLGIRAVYYTGGALLLVAALTGLSAARPQRGEDHDQERAA